MFTANNLVRDVFVLARVLPVAFEGFLQSDVVEHRPAPCSKSSDAIHVIWRPPVVVASFLASRLGVQMASQSAAYSLGWPRWALIVFGIISIVAGILALVWPGATILVLVIALGINILIWGILLVVNAFQAGEGRVLAVILGVLALIAGTALFLRPVRNLGSVDHHLLLLGRRRGHRVDRVRRRSRPGLGLGNGVGLGLDRRRHHRHHMAGYHLVRRRPRRRALDDRDRIHAARGCLHRWGSQPSPLTSCRWRR